MGRAMQQVKSRRTQQQIVHHEPTQQPLPEHGTTETPSAGERYAKAGNQQRCELVGLEGGQGSESAGLGAGCRMDDCRAAAAGGPDHDPIGWAESFSNVEELLLASGERCVQVFAKFEDASNRWYHLGRGAEQYQQDKPLYEGDLRAYQLFAMRVRLEGSTIVATRRLVDDVLRESDATRLHLAAHGLASKNEAGGLVVDQELIDQDLDTVAEAFDLTGYRYDEQVLVEQLETTPGQLLDDLQVQGHGLGFVLSSWRSRAAARRAAEVQGEVTEISEIIACCDRMGELMKLVAGTVSLGAAASAGRAVAVGTTQSAGGALGETLDKATGVVGSPTGLVGAAARAAYQDELHRLAGKLTALTVAQAGWEREGENQQIDEELGEYCQAVERIDAYAASNQARADSFTNGLANLGNDMDTNAIARGYLGRDERAAGPAMETLGRIRATHLALEGLVAPLEQRMAECQVSTAIFGDFSRDRTGQVWLDNLRASQAGHATFYLGIHHGLEGLLADVDLRRAELAGASTAFDATLQSSQA